MGIDPPENVSPKRELEEGEAKRGWGLWRRDLYGVGEALGGKRRLRGWSESEEEVVARESGEGVRGLLAWKGGPSGVEVYEGPLPWDQEGN